MMNTLGKNITGTFFKDENGYQRLITRWSELMNDKENRKAVGAEAHLLYLALRGKDWRKGFKEATNSNKVINGYNNYGGRILQIVNGTKSRWNNGYFMQFFDDIITQEGLDKVRKYIISSETPFQKDAYVDEVE